MSLQLISSSYHKPWTERAVLKMWTKPQVNKIFYAVKVIQNLHLHLPYIKLSHSYNYLLITCLFLNWSKSKPHIITSSLGHWCWKNPNFKMFKATKKLSCAKVLTERHQSTVSKEHQKTCPDPQNKAGHCKRLIIFSSNSGLNGWLIFQSDSIMLNYCKNIGKQCHHHLEWEIFWVFLTTKWQTMV